MSGQICQGSVKVRQRMKKTPHLRLAEIESASASRHGEAVKKPQNEQKHLAQRRKGAEAEKKTKQLFISNFRVSASLREIVYSFTGSEAWVFPSGTRIPPCEGQLLAAMDCTQAQSPRMGKLSGDATHVHTPHARTEGPSQAHLRPDGPLR